MADDTKIGVQSFKEILQGNTVYFHVLRLKKSFLLWIGTEPSMKCLSLAMNNKSGSDVISSQLLGHSTDLASTAVAQRLAKRTGMQCFVSVSLNNPSLLSEAETFIVNKLDTNPSLFYF